MLCERINKLRYSMYFRFAERPRYDKDALRAEGYASQYGQDKWVFENLFPGKRDGVFVDIGANDGVTLSNSLFFEQQGWTGLAIEPIQTAYDKLIASRKCTCVHGGIAAKAGNYTFRQVVGGPEMLSGLKEELDPKHIERIELEMASSGAHYEDITIQCYNLNDLLDEHGIKQVDFLSIDVEGAELSILESLDFSRVDITAFAIENNYRDPRIPSIMKRNGYKVRARLGDEFYVKNV